MDPAIIVGLIISLYAGLGLLGFVIARFSSKDMLAAIDKETPGAASILVGYGEGLRGAVWAAAGICYAMSAALTMAHVADALWVFVAAYFMDMALYFTWRDRKIYVARLKPMERAAEAFVVLALAACLGALIVLRDAGVLK